MPTPFGLIRHGIAADHQGMKGVTRQFERMFTRGSARFVGNVHIGEDVTLEQLTQAFDAVVIATGLPLDRGLDVPGADGPNVYGAGEIIHLLNSHPDAVLQSHPDLLERGLGSNVAIIGSGNVAIDVARLLLKSEEELTGSDVNDAAREGLLRRPILTLRIFGRGPAEKARWDASMLKELAAVQGVRAVLDGVALNDVAEDSGVMLDIEFNSTPTRITGSSLEIAPTERGAGPREYPVDSVITATGFVDPNPNLASDELADEDRARVFRAGGSASGVLGNLAENRKLGALLASRIAAETSPAGRRGLEGLLGSLPPGVTDFSTWQRVDAAEIARARPDRVRWKFHTRDAILAAGEDPSTPTD
jgi:ferredoxin--NADP+ reductase